MVMTEKKFNVLIGGTFGTETACIPKEQVTFTWNNKCITSITVNGMVYGDVSGNSLTVPLGIDRGSFYLKKYQTTVYTRDNHTVLAGLIIESDGQQYQVGYPINPLPFEYPDRSVHITAIRTGTALDGLYIGSLPE